MEKVVAETFMGFIASADKMLQPGKKTNKQIGPNYCNCNRKICLNFFPTFRVIHTFKAASNLSWCSDFPGRTKYKETLLTYLNCTCTTIQISYSTIIKCLRTQLENVFTDNTAARAQCQVNFFFLKTMLHVH